MTNTLHPKLRDLTRSDMNTIDATEVRSKVSINKFLKDHKESTFPKQSQARISMGCSTD
jgi:hypothetical protein